jgi:hypothetical protein
LAEWASILSLGPFTIFFFLLIPRWPACSRFLYQAAPLPSRCVRYLHRTVRWQVGPGASDCSLLHVNSCVSCIRSLAVRIVSITNRATYFASSTDLRDIRQGFDFTALSSSLPRVRISWQRQTPDPSAACAGRTSHSCSACSSAHGYPGSRGAVLGERRARREIWLRYSYGACSSA